MMNDESKSFPDFYAKYDPILELENYEALAGSISPSGPPDPCRGHSPICFGDSATAGISPLSLRLINDSTGDSSHTSSRSAPSAMSPTFPGSVSHENQLGVTRPQKLPDPGLRISGPCSQKGLREIGNHLVSREHASAFLSHRITSPPLP